MGTHKINLKNLCVEMLEKSSLNEGLKQALCAQTTKTEVLSAVHLAHMYEAQISRKISKKEGIYYTPSGEATAMATRLLMRWPLEEEPFPRCADPACGSGSMLIALIDTFSKQHASCLKREDFYDRIFSQCLFGIDVDPAAVEISQIALVLAFSEVTGRIAPPELVRHLQKNIVCADSLLDRHPLLANESFDLILSNPPYGLSRDGRIDPRQNAALKERYAHYRFGKTNHYLLFIAKSLELLRKNGVLSLIVPNSWLGIRSAETLRQGLLDQHELAELTSYDYPVFAEPGVEAVSFVVDRRSRPSTVTTYRALDSKSTPRKIAELAHSFCRELPGSVIPPLLPAPKCALLRRALSSFVALDSAQSPFQPLIALQAYAKGKGSPPQSARDVAEHVYHSDRQTGADCVRYLKGADVSRYKVNWSGSYLKYGPWLAEHQPLSRYQGARVLLREVVSPLPHIISAAVTEECYVYNRSVLHIICKKGVDAQAAWALGALLNSKFASEIVYYLGRKTQRTLFPKLVNDDLKSFPLPAPFFDLIPRLAALAHAMQDDVKNGRYNQEIEHEIESLVSELYNGARAFHAVTLPM